MDQTQRDRITRAREALNEKRHAYDPEQLAAHLGRMGYWLNDIIALAVELDGDMPSLASCGHVRDADGECSCSSWPERAAVTCTCERVAGSHQAHCATWQAAAPACYSYSLPEDYLRGGAQ
jgi:hypothetical protein